MTSRGRQWFMWVICYKENKLFLYPVVLQVVCFLRSSRTCKSKQCVNLPTWGHNVWIFCYREKRQETKVSNRMESWWKETTDLDQTAAANTFFCFSNINFFDWKLTSQHVIGVHAADPHNPNYLQLFDTGLYKGECKTLGCCYKPCQSDRYWSHTHQAKTHHHYEFICKI